MYSIVLLSTICDLTLMYYFVFCYTHIDVWRYIIPFYRNTIYLMNMMCISSCCSILYRNIAIYIIYQVFIPLIGLLLMMQCIRSGYFEHKTARGVFCEEMCLFHIASGLYLNSLNFSRNFLCLFLSKKTRYALVYFSGIANK